MLAVISNPVVVNAHPTAADHHPHPLADQPSRHRVGWLLRRAGGHRSAGQCCDSPLPDSATTLIAAKPASCGTCEQVSPGSLNAQSR